jgi:general secretion pathway protein K
LTLVSALRGARAASRYGDKVNPNIASPPLLQALLLQVGANPDTAAAVAASIVEWRLAGGTAARPSPAVARYVAAGRDYAPSGAPFGSPDELGGVLGMTADLMARLRPHLTVFTDGDPTLATQDPVVALALAAAGQRAVEADEGGSGLMSVTVDARGPGQARLTLHVIVRINGRPEGPRYEILAYERLLDDQQLRFRWRGRGRGPERCPRVDLNLYQDCSRFASALAAESGRPQTE